MAGKLLYVEPPPGYVGEEFNPVCEKYLKRFILRYLDV